MFAAMIAPAALLGILLLATAAAASDESSTAPPNIVLVVADDLGASDLGCTGNRFHETPSLDRLASRGVRFSAAYANAPNCAPSRASILTGLTPPRHGILTVGIAERGDPARRKLVPPPTEVWLLGEHVTLAEALRDAGYACAHVGKWHLGQEKMGGPLLHGFESNVGGNLSGGPRRYFSPYRNPNLPDGPPGEHLTDRLTDEACRFIESHRDRPFFLHLAYYAVHTPHRAKPEKVERYREKASSAQGSREENPVFAAMVESLDEGVGRLVETLERTGLAERTVLVFFSDNGAHARLTSNKPFRGGKGMIYEGGIRVPLLVSGPGVNEPGRVCDEPVQGSDLLPTLLELAGVSLPREGVIDGTSLVPLLGGAASLPRAAIFWHCPVYLEGKRHPGAPDRWFRMRPCGAVRQGRYKLIERFEDGGRELYDLVADPSESRDLAGAQPARVRDLSHLLARWRSEVGAVVPADPNPFYEEGSGR